MDNGSVRSLIQESSPLLEDYARARLKKLAETFLRGNRLGDASQEELRSFFFLPLDVLASQARERGERFVSFANYDYLDLAQHPAVKKAASDVVMAGGVGAGASRLVGGERAVHGKLEQEIAAFIGVEDALVLVSGYLMNVSLIGHLLSPGDLLIYDELSHDSILTGANLSRATAVRFRHNDLDDLARLLEERRDSARRSLIVVEGLYSMDGDMPDLARLVDIKNRYRAWLMIDEAHSFGVLGNAGRGITEHFGVSPREIDLLVGTLSKALAGCGGFIAGKHAVIEWLRFSLPAIIFSAGLPPVVTAGARECLRLLQSEPERVARLRANCEMFRREAAARGFDTGAAGAAVMPILFRSHLECYAAARAALQAGYYAPPILQMAVARSKPRIRFFISAKHTPDQIVGVLDAMLGARESMVERKSRAV